MPGSDLLLILNWWLVFFVLGLVSLPLTFIIFKNFTDRGYLFSKIISIALVSYTVFVLSTFRILPITLWSIILIVWLYAVANFLTFRKYKSAFKKINIRLLFFEEVFFLAGIIVWSFVRAHEPSLNGLEKFMDYGFLNSALRSTYAPVQDMWFTPFSINYYYFGHFATALLTKLSFISSSTTYNLMIATLFSLTFCLSMSLAMNLISKAVSRRTIAGGILTGALVALGGNLHMVYGLFKAYNVDHPVPFWKLPLLISTFPNAYWYPNATRFIPFTIHEFPIYSFVVSDLHGHVLDIPFVLLAIALSLVLFETTGSIIKTRFSKRLTSLKLPQPTVKYALLFLLGLLLAIMYMTNAWDAAIYLLLVMIIIGAQNLHLFKKINFKSFENFLLESFKPGIFLIALVFIFTLPFNIHFKPFASGIGVLCAPNFLTKLGHLGPFLFEASHCQHSTWWELLVLYGFFYFFVVSFLIFLFRIRRKDKITREDLFILCLIFISTILIIVPEFIYVKDIYPQHYRANTMFKLVYQAFIMLSLVSGYAIVRITSKTKNILFYLASIILLIPIFIYPYFAINSYYGDLKNYKGLSGVEYLKDKYPDDYKAIAWINKNISGQPIIAEAQGDSYTDYARISANTGLPTILGWTVHEWLWRGTYDIPAPRITEVQVLYEGPDVKKTKDILNKYKVQYVYVGNLEREKYPNLQESKFKRLGKVVYESGNTRIYKVN